MMVKFLWVFYGWFLSVRHQQWDLRFTRFGRSIATVFPNGVWHTWDKHGNGGYNSVCKYANVMPFEERHYSAKVEAFEACVKQGFLIGQTERR